MISSLDIENLIIASNFAGKNVLINDIKLLIWKAGIETHKPQKLPKGYCAVYIFKWNDIYLKVGKANSKSNARYQSHHYQPNSSKSNLSRSLLKDKEFGLLLNQESCGHWIKVNVDRFNIIIPEKYGDKFVNFVEAFFILKFNPIFEGN